MKVFIYFGNFMYFFRWLKIFSWFNEQLEFCGASVTLVINQERQVN